MKTELKEISPTRKQIDIEIDAGAVRAVYDRITDNYAKAASVPGFRPGHAPRAVVRTRFKDQIRTDVLRELLPDAVQQAVQEHKLEPLGQQSIAFNVSVEVLPDIKLGDYKGLAVARSTRPVKDEDVDRVIESLRTN